MAYTINYTDGRTNGIVVEDYSNNDSDTSLVFAGRFQSDYASTVASNFLHLLENFANDSAPDNPAVGQTWFDSDGQTSALKVYDGSAWREVGGIKRSASENQLESNSVGDLWVNTETNQLHVYNGETWILVGPSSASNASSGFDVDVIKATDNVDYAVLVMRISGSPVVILSTQDFTPRSRIAGFSSIKKGVNLTSRQFGDSPLKYWGTSEKAESLIVGGRTVPSRNFLRSDRQSTTDFPFNIRSNEGVFIGSGDSRTSISINGVDTVLRNSTSSEFQFRFQQDPAVLKVASSGTVTVSDTLNVQGNLEVAVDSVMNSIIPSDSPTSSIGDVNSPYNILYASNIFGDEFSGKAQTAVSLDSAVDLSIIGDVASTVYAFDGSSNLQMSVKATSSLFDTGTPGPSEMEPDDEVLISRSSTTNELFTVNFATMARGVMPVGTVVPYLGDTPPSGWILCDGTTYADSDYPELFEKIGAEFVSGTSFTVPDLSNRLLMGNPADLTDQLSSSGSATISSISQGVNYIIYTGVYA